jgi:hypothetical protein
MRSRLLPSVANALQELFALNGDVHAALYTGSRALNSAMMGMLDGATGGKRKGVSSSPAASTATQIGISVQRRFVNLTLDSSRQVAFEAFLGQHGASKVREEGEPAAVVRLAPAESGSQPSATASVSSRVSNGISTMFAAATR